MTASSDNEFIVFGAPDIHDAEVAEVEATIQSGWLGTGPRVAQFEAAFADYKDVDKNHVAAVNSCTAALHVSMVAAGLGPGDEVLTTAMTFCATVNAVIHAGATPVPVDIDPVSLCIDVEQLASKISERTKAIVPVHFAGRPCEMDVINSLAAEHGLLVIEDCAHAIETLWHGRSAGTLGDFGCFSFYVTKNVATGEGGMVIAQSPEAIERIKVLALHGMTKDAWHRYSDEGYKHYQVVEAGFKYNMMDIQAALGIHQLERVDVNWQRRQSLWTTYQKAFESMPVGRPAEPEAHTRHGYHLYTLKIDEAECGVTRDEFMNHMQNSGVGVGVHYLCLASHPYYQDRFGWRVGDNPVADDFGSKTVSLPFSPKLSDSEVARVIEASEFALNR